MDQDEKYQDDITQAGKDPDIRRAINQLATTELTPGQITRLIMHERKRLHDEAGK